MDHILTTILNDTFTLSVLKHRLMVLKTYLNQKFFNPAGKAEFEAQDLAWLKSQPAAFFQTFTPDNITQFFSQLEKQIQSLKVLTIYLTFEPDNETLSQIGVSLRKTFKDLYLMDVKYDPNLIAGPALVWKGVYKDYSLRSQIEQKKEMILQSFKKYLR